MPHAPRPANEAERLSVLMALDILDTPPDQDFDRVTRLASRQLRTPMAAVSLIDTDRQWFKSRVGLDCAQSARDDAFCAHAIMGRELLIVPDARADPRFAENPFVVRDPFIRFYAGVPLQIQGVNIGVLCVLDTQPHHLSADESAALSDLGELACSLFRQRHLAFAAQSAQLARDEFLGTVGHDLRVQLTSVLGFAELLQDLCPRESEQHSLAGTILRSGRTMLRLLARASTNTPAEPDAALPLEALEPAPRVRLGP